MARADVLVAGGVSNNQRILQSSCVVETPTFTKYMFFVDTGNNLYWIKSSDGGITWTDPVAVSSSLGIVNFDVHYDKETPGNTGTLIHLVYIDSVNDDVFYRSLDTNGDSLSSQVTIFAGATTGSNSCISITRAVGGNLYCKFDIDGGTETGFYRSTDVGANWTSRSNSAEGADYFLLVPGFGADNQDIMSMFWDRSAGEISRKIYDNSADSWAETSIATGMTAIATTTCTPQFAVTIDDANNKIILIAWTNRDTNGADLRAWKIDETSITALTDVVTDSGDDQQCCALALNNNNGDLYALYGGKSDGSETAGTSINIYYKVSTDDGATWGSETQISASPRNFDILFTSAIFYSNMPTVIYKAEVGAPSGDNILMSVILPQARARVALGLG